MRAAKQLSLAVSGAVALAAIATDFVTPTTPAHAAVGACTTPTVAFVKDVQGNKNSVRIARGGAEAPWVCFHRSAKAMC